MTTHATLVRGLYEDCLNRRDLDALPTFLAPDFEGANGERGPSGFRRTVERMVAAFPDLMFVIEDLFACSDRVCVRWSFEATHAGPLAGHSATGRRVTQNGIAIYRVRDGRLDRAWLQVDRLGVLQQIGAVPASG
ncbi:ester cyclase [Segnochrobactrum spirostomi]|uniref:Ester cyclase n=1 Tax=Segnochrobactrum spirostomi TaxID=2608987 RepID=A0A6A7XZI2_9HYPH|nr:ester cyclase [Segnochrobactrum spirostomi]MQT12104.1 ester cyclase [Segnochrobactrum spirostomi]